MAYKKILRGSAVLSLNEIVSNGCSFIRNIILARIISKGDAGIANLLGVTFLFLEFTSKMAFGQLVISSKNGGDRRFVDTEHTVQLAIGLCSSLIFFALAQPLAEILGVPQLASGLRILACSPLCMSLANLGAWTYAREMHFERAVSMEIIPQIIVTIVAWPLAVWLKDFRAFIWLQVGKVALSILVSWIVAGRRYSLGFRMDYCREIFKFSWPLVLAGLIMICSSQGDRLLMTKGYSLADLGTYGVAWSIAATPTLAILKIVGGTALPMMAKAADNRPVLRTQYALLAQIFSLCGTLFALTMIIGGENIMTLLFRDKYAGAGIIAGWIACGQAARMIRGAPIGVAWGRNETGTQMVGNLVRMLALLIVVPVVWLKASLIWVAIAGMIGEILALTVNTVAVRRKHDMEMSLCFIPTLVAALCIAAAGATANWLFPSRGYIMTAFLLAVSYGLSALIFSTVFPEIGGEITRIRNALARRISRQPVVPTPGVDSTLQ